MLLRYVLHPISRKCAARADLACRIVFACRRALRVRAPGAPHTVRWVVQEIATIDRFDVEPDERVSSHTIP